MTGSFNSEKMVDSVCRTGANSIKIAGAIGAQWITLGIGPNLKQWIHNACYDENENASCVAQE